MDQLKSNENTNRCIVDSPAGHSLGCAEMLSLKQDHLAKTGCRTSTKLLAFYVHVLMFLSKSHQKEQSCSRVCNSYDYVDTIQSHVFSDNGPNEQVGLTPQCHIWRLSPPDVVVLDLTVWKVPEDPLMLDTETTTSK